MNFGPGWRGTEEDEASAEENEEEPARALEEEDDKCMEHWPRLVLKTRAKKTAPGY